MKKILSEKNNKLFAVDRFKFCRYITLANDEQTQIINVS